MQRSHRDSFTRGGFAALMLFAVSLALGGCATAPPGHTQLSWPVGTTYTVRDGDTVSEIAEYFSLSEDALARYNGLRDPDRIYAGQVLRIPRHSRVARARPAPHRTHRTRVARREHHERRTHKYYERRAPRHPDRIAVVQRGSAPVHFIWPVDGRVISSFGVNRNGARNDGINIAARLGEPIHAAASGTVTYAGDELKGYGNLVLLRHGDGYVTAYAHAQSITVNRGDRVRKGQVIGYAGATGDVRRPQLHFEIRHGVRPLDPKPLLVASNGV
jgi:murein DD-endopeptidase MepM/ murein hydrolase activator NlpD